MPPDDDFNPETGRPEQMGHSVRRILAPNPSPMTYRGTNTYLVGETDLVVIDPGPQDDRHLRAILDAVGPGQRISHILVTHAHLDHSPLAPRLAALTGAPVYAYGDATAGRSAVMHQLHLSGGAQGGEGVDAGFTPDISLADGQTLIGPGWKLTAHWTPGHFGNHMCFALADVVFTGDLVMGWASSLVSPPDGDLTDFMASCRKMQRLDAAVYHAGHGAPITDPAARLNWLIRHRQSREAAILLHLGHGPATAQTLTTAIYTDTPPALLPAATRNVLAHLIDLHGKNKVSIDQGITAHAQFSLKRAAN
jgi:glyoxylase-like metal-dependent hydrolase (beta-lactamase superfamily II)